MNDPIPLRHEPLLATKLYIPQPRPHLLPRPRLRDRLERGRTCGLILVSAPAGYGKTTLLSAWLQSLHTPAAWLTLDAADNDPTRFLRYLLAALQRCDAAIGQALSRALAAPQPPPPAALAGALINDLMSRTSSHFLLVLDDVHLIEDAAVFEILQMFVLHRPPSLQLVIATREDPPLPLARLRAQGELAEIRAQDLRFSPAESDGFLREVMGLALPAPALAALTAQVEGWAAGLQLAALAWQRQDTQDVTLAPGSHHFILNYLTEEVLRRLPAAQQRFLLDTAALPRLSGPLCDFVLDRTDSAAQLEELYAANIFVTPLDDAHQWWRYHHLFADLLRTQMQRTQPARAAEVRRRASAWFAAQDEPDAAIDLALAAEDYAQAAQLIEVHARQAVRLGYLRTVETWLQRLPDSWHAAGAHANLAFAWSLLLRGRVSDVEPYLLRALRPPSAPATEADHGVQAEALALRAALIALRGQAAESCTLAEEAVALAPEDDFYVRGVALFGLGTAYNYAGRSAEAIAVYRRALPLCRAAGNTVAANLIVGNLALLYVARGQLHAAAALCRAVIDAAAQTGDVRAPALAVVHGAYSHVFYEWGDFATAQRHSAYALEGARLGGHAAALGYGGVMASRILLALGELAAADASLAQALELRGRALPAWVGPHRVAQQVALALAHGDVAAAQHALQQSGVGLTDPTGQHVEVIHLAWLHLLLDQAQRTAPDAHLLDTAHEVAGRVLAAATAGDRMGVALEALLLRARVRVAQGDTAAARADVRQALRLGESEEYVRPFTAGGASIHLLIADLHAEVAALPILAETDLAPAYLARLLQTFPTLPITPARAALSVAPRPAPAALVEPLSIREVEVLRLLAEGLTYQEIADHLIVSVNTVRFHVKTIYGKLGVDKRLAAVDAARLHGLL